MSQECTLDGRDDRGSHESLFSSNKSPREWEEAVWPLKTKWEEKLIKRKYVLLIEKD